jgi:AcrR family transcriptional regulator
MNHSPERDRLLNLVADVILKRGMLNLSLSAIAREIGSNNRMLLYYFSSLELLLNEASMVAFNRFPRLQKLFNNLAQPGDLEDRLVQAWDDLSWHENIPYLRLYFQRFGVAMRDPEQWRRFTSRVGLEWISTVSEILRREGIEAGEADSLATEVVALWRGYQVLLLTETVPPEALRDSYRSAVHRLIP